MITAEQLREVLSYEPLTGLFHWKVERNSYAGKVKPGALAGSRHPAGYWRIGIDGRRYKAHRLAWLYVYGEWPKERLDHRDGDNSNNRIDNLREATNAQNIANSKRRSTNTSGIKGVCWNNGKWLAQITHMYQNHYLGHFSSKEDAAAAYARAAHELHGEFARLA